MQLSHLLYQFQSIRQHMAFVVDEHGTIVGIVTLEDVLEQLVGEVQDEFDAELPDIVPDGDGKYILLGSTLIEDLKNELNLNLHSEEMDAISGLLIEHFGKMLSPGVCVDLDNRIKAKVIEVEGNRASSVRLTIQKSLNEDLNKDLSID